MKNVPLFVDEATKEPSTFMKQEFGAFLYNPEGNRVEAVYHVEIKI